MQAQKDNIEHLGNQFEFEYGRIKIIHYADNGVWLAETFDEEANHYTLFVIEDEKNGIDFKEPTMLFDILAFSPESLLNLKRAVTDYLKNITNITDN